MIEGTEPVRAHVDRGIEQGVVAVYKSDRSGGDVYGNAKLAGLAWCRCRVIVGARAYTANAHRRYDYSGASIDITRCCTTILKGSSIKSFAREREDTRFQASSINAAAAGGDADWAIYAPSIRCSKQSARCSCWVVVTSCDRTAVAIWSGS